MMLYLFWGYRSMPVWTHCNEEAMQLKLALRLYQARTASRSRRWKRCVPKYLPAVPADPTNDPAVPLPAVARRGDRAGGEPKGPGGNAAASR